jgi:phosphoribosylamine--glycine ligase
MKILVIGSGGREHALTWKLRESQLMKEIYCAPGNPGIAQEAECRAVDVNDPKAILALAQDLKVDLTVMGPETPLVAGAVDALEGAGLWAVGPTRAAAQLEGSKIFSKRFMQRHGIPTARFEVVDDFESAIKALRNFPVPVVVKADGLAAGKGVVVARTREEAELALDDFMRQKTLGEAGARVVLEECLTGEELSFIVLSDGKNLLPLVPAQDHKPVFDNDQGPNTGGMGAYSDDAMLSAALKADIIKRIALPTIRGMAAEGNVFRGFLYIGLMLTPAGPSVLEYNVRLGDPEAQPILMRLRSDLVEIFKVAREGELHAMDVRWSPSPAVCVVLASKGYPGKPELGKVITGYDAAEELGGVKVFHAGTTFREGKLLTAGGRVLGVTATGTDLKSALERAYAAVAKIHFDGMHYRRDIGAKGLKRIAAKPARSKTAAAKPQGAQNA